MARPLDPRRNRSAGYTLLEVLVAFVVLGISLAGVGPMVVMQLKLSRKSLIGINPQTGFFGASRVAYLVPDADPWMRKLGAGASCRQAPGLPVALGSALPPVNDVAIVGPVVYAATGDAIRVTVSVNAHPPGIKQ